MANFTNIHLQGNDNTDASPNWVPGGASPTAGLTENRWGVAGISANTASASWPLYDRDTSVTPVPMVYMYTADATGNNYDSYSVTSTTASNYLMMRVNADNVGTMGSAPIISAYTDTNHNGSPPTNDNTIIGGNSTDTSSKSYLKGAVFGFQTGSPTVAPSAANANTYSGTTGSAGAVTGPTNATWSTWQSMQADIQYLQCGATPSATTAFLWYFIMVLFNGPGLNTGTLTPVVSLKYTYI